MVAHRFEGQPQLISDLLIAAAARHQRQQFALPLAQFWKDPCWDGGPGCREEAEHAFGNARAEDGLATGDSADRPQDLSLVGAFEDVASGPGAHGGKDRLVV